MNGRLEVINGRLEIIYEWTFRGYEWTFRGLQTKRNDPQRIGPDPFSKRHPSLLLKMDVFIHRSTLRPFLLRAHVIICIIRLQAQCHISPCARDQSASAPRLVCASKVISRCRILFLFLLLLLRRGTVAIRTCLTYLDKG